MLSFPLWRKNLSSALPSSQSRTGSKRDVLRFPLLLTVPKDCSLPVILGGRLDRKSAHRGRPERTEGWVQAPISLPSPMGAAMGTGCLLGHELSPSEGLMWVKSLPYKCECSQLVLLGVHLLSAGFCIVLQGILLLISLLSTCLWRKER